MLVRIVKLTFKKENIASFEHLFEDTREQIRRFEGCTYLTLLRDRNDPTVYFTLSHWDSEEQLDQYRTSRLFKGVWDRTKVLFRERPEAWSLDTRKQ